MQCSIPVWPSTPPHPSTALPSLAKQQWKGGAPPNHTQYAQQRRRRQQLYSRPSRSIQQQWQQRLLQARLKHAQPSQQLLHAAWDDDQLLTPTFTFYANQQCLPVIVAAA